MIDTPRTAAPRWSLDGGREYGFDLRWLTSVLWPDADVRLAPARVPPGRRVAEAYAVVPNASRPRLLVPFASPSVAADLTWMLGDGTMFARSRRAVASRLGRWSYPPLVVFFGRDPRPDELLTNRIREILDRPDVSLAVSWTGSGLDRIPVAHAVSLEGEILAVAKVGWSPPTRALVANEAAVLGRWAAARPAGFTVPTLLFEGAWGARVLSVTTPDPPARRRLGRRAGSLVEPIREIGRAGGIALAPLARTPWWRSALARASEDDALSTVLRWMADLHGRRLVWQGSAHGDWTTRNLSVVAGTLHVSGWEHARDGVPLGLDALHLAFEGRGRRDRERGLAIRPALGAARPTLRRLGIPREDDALLAACYLAERLLRMRGAAERGRWGTPRSPMLDQLRRWVGRA